MRERVQRIDRGMHFMPLDARAFVVRDFPLECTRAARDEATRIALRPDTTIAAEIQNDFRRAGIVLGRFGFLVKSMVAVRTGPQHA